jgi:hypothetical protein
LSFVTGISVQVNSPGYAKPSCRVGSGAFVAEGYN